MSKTNVATADEHLDSKHGKEGERILGPTRRPDGTLRKPVRIRAGYVPQDEVAIYQSKGALWRKEIESQQAGPPGYDPAMDVKPKSKSAKRNERKKEKKLQADSSVKINEPGKEAGSGESLTVKSETVEAVASQMSQMDISRSSPETGEGANSADAVLDIDKRIRALKKKIRLTEAQQQKMSEQDMKSETMEKVRKLDSWREEVKLLEEKKAKQHLRNHHDES